MVYALSPQLPRLLGFLLLPIVSQYVTSIDYGIYANWLSLNLLFSYFTNFGFTVLLTTSFVNESDWKQKWSVYFVYNQVLALILGFCQVIIFYLLFRTQFSPNFSFLCFSSVISIAFLQVTILFGQRLIQLNQQSERFGIITLLSNLVMVICNLIGIIYFKIGFLAWILGYLICLVIQFLGFGHYLFFSQKLKIQLQFDFADFFKTLALAWPMFLHVFTYFVIIWSDRIILQFLNVPLPEIGKYSVAYVWANYVEIVSNSFGIVLGAAYVKMLKNNQLAQLQVFNDWFKIVFLFLIFVLCLFMKEISFFWIRNVQLNQSYLISILLIFGYALKPIYWLQVNQLIVENKSKILWKFSTIAGIVNIVLNFVLVPDFGILGSAIATLISFVFMNYICFFIDKSLVIKLLTKANLIFIVLWLLLGILCMVFYESYLLSKFCMLLISILIIFKVSYQNLDILKDSQQWFVKN